MCLRPRLFPCYKMPPKGSRFDAGFTSRYFPSGKARFGIAFSVRRSDIPPVGVLAINNDEGFAEFRATPVTGAKAVSSVVEKFREKYGAKDVKKYSSKFDVAVVTEMG